MCPLWVVVLYIQFKIIYALFINGENETVLYWQWFVIQVPFIYKTVICYTCIQVPFIDSDLLYMYTGALYRQWFVIHVSCIQVPFIDSNLLYTGVLYRQLFVIYRCPLRQVWLIVFKLWLQLKINLIHIITIEELVEFICLLKSLSW